MAIVPSLFSYFVFPSCLEPPAFDLFKSVQRSLQWLSRKVLSLHGKRRKAINNCNLWPSHWNEVKENEIFIFLFPCNERISYVMRKIYLLALTILYRTFSYVELKTFLTLNKYDRNDWQYINPNRTILLSDLKYT